MRRLKAKRPSRIGLALPSLEQSERINRGAITLAFPLLTFGLLIGMVLSLAREGQRPGFAGAHAAWTDPKVVSALVMWLVFAVLLARAVPAGDAGPERDDADDRGVCVPGLHLGGRRGAAAAHGPRRGHGERTPGG